MSLFLEDFIDKEMKFSKQLKMDTNMNVRISCLKHT